MWARWFWCSVFFANTEYYLLSFTLIFNNSTLINWEHPSWQCEISQEWCAKSCWAWVQFSYSPIWSREHRTISSSSFLAECRERWPNQGSFVLKYFALFDFFELYLFCLFSCTVLFVSMSFKMAPSSSIWPHLSYGLVRSKREYCHNCSLVVLLCSFL